MYEKNIKILRLQICNRKPARDPSLFGNLFVLCWRCTGIMIGTLTSILFLSRVLALSITLKYILGIALVFPIVYDTIFRIFYLGKTGNNIDRILTGLCCGIGLDLIFNPIY